MKNFLWFFVFCLRLQFSVGTNLWHIAAVEIDWNYGITGPGVNNYKKTVFKAYTDDTFSIESPRDWRLGLLGPHIIFNANENITVVLRNNLRKPISIHPQRLIYNKENEGTLDYPRKLGNMVQPGSTRSYLWQTSGVGPGPQDPPCLSSLYYSDANQAQDINDGLIGFLTICRPEYAYQEENSIPPFLALDVQEQGQLFTTLNGFTRSEPLSICVARDVTLSVAAWFYANDAISVSFLGHTLNYRNQRSHFLSLASGQAKTARLVPYEIGQWGLQFKRGKGLLNVPVNVSHCDGGAFVDYTVTREIKTYYLSAENRHGDDGQSYTSFFQYADESFRNIVRRTETDQHLGLLGPLLIAEVGQTLKLVVINRSTRPVTIHAHGVRVNHRMSGVSYDNFTTSLYLEPNPRRFRTVFWTIPREYFSLSAPDPCVASYYFSAAMETDVVNGLIGPMLICKEGSIDTATEKPRGRPNYFLFYVMREDGNGEQGFLNGVNGKSVIPPIQTSVENDVNVHAMVIGSSMATSITVDVNTFIWRGKPSFTVPLYPGSITSARLKLTDSGRVTVTLGAVTSIITTLLVSKTGSAPAPADIPENITDRYFFKIRKVYYDVAHWTVNIDDWLGSLLAHSADRSDNDQLRAMFSDVRLNFALSYQIATYAFLMKKSGVEIGPDFLTVEFKSYANSDMIWARSKVDNMPANTIRINVGASISLYLTNQLPRPFSIYAQGVRIRRVGSGVGSSDSSDLVVRQGENATFIWTVPDTISWGENESDCLIRHYYSNMDEVRDISSGLYGPLIICKAGKTLESDRKILMLGSLDFTQSWLLSENLPSGEIPVGTDLALFKEDFTVHIYDGSLVSSGRPVGVFYEYLDFYVYNFGWSFHTLHFHGAKIINTTSWDAQWNDNNNVISVPPRSGFWVNIKFHYKDSWKYEEIGVMSSSVYRPNGVIRYDDSGSIS